MDRRRTFIFVTLVLALIIIACICGWLTGAFSGEPSATAPTASPVESAQTAAPAATGAEPSDEAAYADDTVFIGDSTTYGLKYYGVVDGNNVWTPSSGTLALFNQSFATIIYPPSGEDIPITDAVERGKPAAIVLTVGVNGVSAMDESSFKNEYASLVERIRQVSPDTAVICNSIYPVEASYEAKENGINNEVIDRANGWIRTVAEQTGSVFADSASVLKDGDGKLAPAYGNGDGIHLNADGFNRVIDYLRSNSYI